MSENHIQELKFANSIFIPEIIKFLEQGHTVTIKLKGYSMRPFLENNRDKAILRKPDKLKIGDVVLAEISPQNYALHRIIKIIGENIVLRGDGNLTCEYCKSENIKGYAVGFYRKGKKNMDSTNSMKWKLYSKVWCSLFPIRRYLLAFYRILWIPLFETK